jgi:hypothetical protein
MMMETYSMDAEKTTGDYCVEHACIMSSNSTA